MILRTPWANQPQLFTQLDPYWVSRGLVLVFAGNRVIYDRASTQTPTVVGPAKLVPARFASGVAVTSGYGATYGTGTTDRVDGVLLPTASVGRSIVAHVYRNGTGGGTFGRILDSGPAIGNEFFYHGAGSALVYARYIQSAAASTAWTSTHTIPASRWSVQGITCPQDVTGRSADFYSDGALSGTVTNAGSGTYGTYQNIPSFGNRVSDSLRNWDGLLGPVLLFDGLLTAAEHAALAANPWQVFAPVETFWFGQGAASGSTGTVAYTNANDTSAASGTTTVLGTLARTNANDTSAASGTTTVLGTLATTNADDTVAASGTTTVTGTLATTNANDTCAASGSAGANSGTVAYTNANDTASAAGWAGTITGTLARTNADDTVSAAGTAASGVTQGAVGYWPNARRKSRKEVHQERIKLGILPPAIVKAAAKVAEAAATVEEFRAERPRYEDMFLRELQVTKWSPDYTRAIQAQLEIIEQEDDDILLFM